MPYEVILVDDHKILRDGVKALVERNPEFKVVAEADSGPDAIQICKRVHPDLVIMDVALPGLDGIETTKEILRQHPAAKVIILSMYDDEDSVLGAIRSGARAFVLKKASAGDLMDAMRTVAHGGSYLGSQVSDRLLGRIQRGDLTTRSKNQVLELLTPRERQVLRLISEGKTSKEIAAVLSLGVETVRSYRKAMMKKLGVNNVAGLIQISMVAGLTRWTQPETSEPQA
jgi:DNA-binding NarL/FixJ family response regulator